MRKIYLLFVMLVLCAATLFAQAPQKFSYQAVVRNATNQLVTNSNVGVRLSVLQGTATGNAVYVETQTVTTNGNGLLTLEVGGGNAIQGSFAVIEWGDGPYYLKTEIDPNGGNNYSITSVQQMLSVPYALYAAEAGNVPAFVILPTDTGYVLVLTPAGGTPQTYVLRNGVDGAQGPEGPQGLPGATGPEGPQGLPGAQGPEGPAGVGIQSITGPVTSGLEDTYTIHYTDGTTSTFVVTNGAAGAQGLQGSEGPQGLPGAQGPEGPAGVGIQSITGPVTSGLEDTYTIHYTDGTTSTFVVTNGAAGAQGLQGPEGPQGPAGEGVAQTLTIVGDQLTISGGNTITLPSGGGSGTPGRGIQSVTGPVTSGLEDTYTIHYTDGTTSTFVVTNGAAGAQGLQGPEGSQGPTGTTGPEGPVGPQGAAGVGIQSITGPVTSGLEDTYTIHYTDGTTSTFVVTNGAAGAQGPEGPQGPAGTGVAQTLTIVGDQLTISGGNTITLPSGGGSGTPGRGIQSITGPVTSGLEDTYTIHYTDGTTSTFVVTNGAAGAQGLQGPEGPQGPTGATGPEGPQGLPGATGPEGPQGPTGATGPEGPQGLPGAQGPEGPAGVGIQSITGPVTSGLEDTYTIHYTDGTTSTFVVTNGAAGAQGLQGPEGPQGPTGATGPEGPQGLPGATGPEGPQGPTGATGPEGPQGPTGATGPEGPQGLPGAQGPEGPAGVGIQSITGPVTSGLEDTYTIHYTDGTTSTFVVTNGAAGAQGLQGPEGPQGLPGATGPEGPQGPTGATGATGPEGPAGVGIQSITGPVSSGATDTYTIHYTDGTTTTFSVTNNFASQVNADWNATSGVAEILNKPNVPTQSDIQAMIDQSVAGLSAQIAQQQAKIDSLQNALNSQNANNDLTFFCGSSEVSDVDGNAYKTVKIGNQCWMREHLRVTHRPDGSSLEYAYPARPNNDWEPKYGLVYAWNTLMNGAGASASNPSGVQGICPDGWHVPSAAEFNQLTDYLASKPEFVCGSSANSVSKALASKTGWASSSVSCAVGNNPSNNNASGFDAYPSYESNNYYNYMACLWTSTAILNPSSNWAGTCFNIEYNKPSPSVTSNESLNNRYALRCVRNVADGVISQLQSKVDSLQESLNTRPTVNITACNPGDKINFPLVTAQATTTDNDLILAKGFCWGTSQNPTIQSGNYVIVDTNTTTYKALLTSLTSMTSTYYVRAFATNANGTSYSDQVTIQRADYYAVPRSGSKTIYMNPGDEIWVYDIGGPNGNYAENNLNGYLTVASNNMNYKVMLVQGSYATESSYDYLEVYEGDVTNATSGYLKRFGGSGNVVPLAPSPSNEDMTLRFRSDVSNSAYAGFAVKFIVVSRPCTGTTTVTDYDENVYNTVEIGEQCWMKENLRTTHYANGAPIAQGSTSLVSSSAKYYYYPGNSSSYVNTYGLLYNWSAAANNTGAGTATTASSKLQGVCPNGWHLPANAELVTLSNYISSNSYYGPVAKALSSTTGWTTTSTANAPGNTPETNNYSGFNAKAAGLLNGNYSPYQLTELGLKSYLWSSTRVSDTNYNIIAIYNDAPNVSVGTTNVFRSCGLSVRCIKN